MFFSKSIKNNPKAYIALKSKRFLIIKRHTPILKV